MQRDVVTGPRVCLFVCLSGWLSMGKGFLEIITWGVIRMLNSGA